MTQRQEWKWTVSNAGESREWQLMHMSDFFLPPVSLYFLEIKAVHFKLHSLIKNNWLCGICIFSFLIYSWDCFFLYFPVNLSPGLLCFLSRSFLYLPFLEQYRHLNRREKSTLDHPAKTWCQERCFIYLFSACSVSYTVVSVLHVKCVIITTLQMFCFMHFWLKKLRHADIKWLENLICEIQKIPLS